MNIDSNLATENTSFSILWAFSEYIPPNLDEDGELLSLDR